MSNVLLMATVTFKESLRNKVLYGIFLFGLLLFFANLIFTGMFSFELNVVAVDVGLSVVSFSGLVIVLFLGIHSLTNDLERRTIYLVLSRPVTRLQYLLGKYCGLVMTICLSSLILGLLASGSVVLSFWNATGSMAGGFSWGMFILGIVYSTFAVCLIMALALLWTCIASHPFTAILLTIASYFVGQNVETVRGIAMRSPVFADNLVLTWVIKIASWLFPNLAAFDLKTTVAYGLPVDAGYLLLVACYALAYIAICLLLSLFVFQRRELV